MVNNTMCTDIWHIYMIYIYIIYTNLKMIFNYVNRVIFFSVVSYKCQVLLNGGIKQEISLMRQTASYPS